MLPSPARSWTATNAFGAFPIVLPDHGRFTQPHCFALISAVKKKRIIFLALLLLLIAGLAIYLRRPKEPGYQGKTLTKWLQKYEADRTESGQAACARAINAIGTNGIPTLLKLLTGSGLPGSAKLQSAVDSLG